MTTHTGQCLCGKLKYQISKAPEVAGVCHCKNCQRQTGSAFSSIVGVAKTDFKFTRGELKLYQDSDTDSGNKVERYFCGDCGSPIYSIVAGQPDTLYIKTGTLDDTADFKPQFHVWCDSKQNWVQVDPDVPTMGKQS